MIWNLIFCVSPSIPFSILYFHMVVNDDAFPAFKKENVQFVSSHHLLCMNFIHRFFFSLAGLHFADHFSLFFPFFPNVDDAGNLWSVWSGHPEWAVLSRTVQPENAWVLVNLRFVSPWKTVSHTVSHTDDPPVVLQTT